MILVIYFIILCFVFYFTKDVSDKDIRKMLRWLYNYIVGVIIYFILGYHATPVKNINAIILNIFSALYFAVKGMAFDRSFVLYKDVFHKLGDALYVEMQIWGIFLIASVSTALTVISIIFKEKIRMQKLIYKFNNQKEKIIIVGNNKSALTLINSVQNDAKYKDSVIELYTDMDTDNLGDKSVIVKKISDFIEKNPINNFNTSFNYKIVLMLKDKNQNIEIFGKLNSIVDAEKKNLINNNTNQQKEKDIIKNLIKKYKNIEITVLCENEQLRFNSWQDSILDVFLISTEQLVADTLIKSHSPISSMPSDSFDKDEDGFKYNKNPYYVCVIGFGDLGEELLLSAYENSRFIKEDNTEVPFKALVIDKNMTELKSDFLADVPYFKDNNHIEFVDASIGTQAFYDVIEKHMPSLNQILISTGNNKINIKTAMKLISIIRNKLNPAGGPEIIIFIRDEDYMLEPITMNKLFTISVSDNIYTCDNIIKRTIDEEAKLVHNKYRLKHIGTDKDKEWHEISIFEKNSNRAAARDKKNKETLIGTNKINDTLAWKLAPYEHYRFVGYHISHGWTKLEIEEFNQMEKKATKLPQQKKHLCLVGWAELSDLPCQPDSGNFHKNDFNSVKSIFENNDTKK